jgi:hypothetical protein
MPTPVFHIHSRTEIYESPLSPKAFGTDNWGKVNEFHRLAPDAPVGEGTRFEQGMVYEAFHAVFVARQPWEVTRWFKYNVGLIQKGRVLWECHTREELLDRLNVEVRALAPPWRGTASCSRTRSPDARRTIQEVFALCRRQLCSSLSPTHEIKLGVNSTAGCCSSTVGTGWPSPRSGPVLHPRAGGVRAPGLCAPPPARRRQ